MQAVLDAARLQVQTRTCMCKDVLPSRPRTLPEKMLYPVNPCRRCGEAPTVNPCRRCGEAPAVNPCRRCGEAPAVNLCRRCGEAPTVNPCRRCGEAPTVTAVACFTQSPTGPLQHVRKLNAVPNEAGARVCRLPRRGARDPGSFLLIHVRPPENRPGSPLLLRRYKPGHSHGCSTAVHKWTVRGGCRRELLMKSHVGRARQACPLHLSSAPSTPLGFLPVAKTMLAAGQSPAAEWSRLSSEQPPVSRVSLPSKTSRQGHLHQDTPVAGLE
nr:Anks6 protein [Rattus norvegicus]